jgi:ABC-2 type transport system ATP-binding protein
MSDLSIRIEGLEKIYRDRSRKGSNVHALKPLSLDVARGEVFGLLGPNGAGKTTLVKLLLGVVFPTTGTATILDRRIGTVPSKQLVGYLPENHRYPNYLTGAGVLNYFGRLSGLDTDTLRKRSDTLLEMVNMSKWRNTKVKKYSKGMMQRLGIAQALINDPQVVFLDEPTDGVDPLGRKEIRDFIVQLRDQGKTIFLNSHLLSEVELISDRVAILNKGSLVRLGTVNDLTQSERLYSIQVAAGQEEKFGRLMREWKVARSVEATAATVEPADMRQLNGWIDRLRSEEILITSITPIRHSLEELFIDIIGKEDAR